jgi:hypothetical protein
MWNMRTEFTACLICAFIAGAAASIAPSTVLAQQQPKPFPWERDADKFFSRNIPKVENPIDKRIQEGLRSLGMPAQPKLDITGNSAPLPEPPGLSQSVIPRLDTNRDGVVSEREYLLGRQRPSTAGGQGTHRQVRRAQRLGSRFRAADRNRDGRLSGPEIDAMKGRRF